MKSNVKEIIETMSPDERKKLKEYSDSLKEIRKEISEMIKTAKDKRMQEVGGNMMGKSLPIK
jgi:F0F1-type ATP synthase membrane subunit b/b'